MRILPGVEEERKQMSRLFCWQRPDPIESSTPRSTVPGFTHIAIVQSPLLRTFSPSVIVPTPQGWTAVACPPGPLTAVNPLHSLTGSVGCPMCE